MARRHRCLDDPVRTGEDAADRAEPVRRGGAGLGGDGVLGSADGALSTYRVNTAPASGLPRSSTLCTRTEPQLLMSTGTGGTKSFNAAVNESDERLFR
jgi:hypothetical protein